MPLSIFCCFSFDDDVGPSAKDDDDDDDAIDDILVPIERCPVKTTLRRFAAVVFKRLTIGDIFLLHLEFVILDDDVFVLPLLRLLLVVEDDAAAEDVLLFAALLLFVLLCVICKLFILFGVGFNRFGDIKATEADVERMLDRRKRRSLLSLLRSIF